MGNIASLKQFQNVGKKLDEYPPATMVDLSSRSRSTSHTNNSSTVYQENDRIVDQLPQMMLKHADDEFRKQLLVDFMLFDSYTRFRKGEFSNPQELKRDPQTISHLLTIERALSNRACFAIIQLRDVFRTLDEDDHDELEKDQQNVDDLIATRKEQAIEEVRTVINLLKPWRSVKMQQRVNVLNAIVQVAQEGDLRKLVSSIANELVKLDSPPVALEAGKKRPASQEMPNSCGTLKHQKLEQSTTKEEG